MTTSVPQNLAAETAWHWTDPHVDGYAYDPTPRETDSYEAGIGYGYERACAEILKNGFTPEIVADALAQTIKAHPDGFGLMDVIAYLVHRGE